MQNNILFNTTSFTSDLFDNFITRTLLMGLVAFLLFFVLIRTFDKLGYNKTIKKIIRQKWDLIKHGNAIMLVKDGVLQLDKLHLANITVQQVYAALHRKKINNLAEVDKLFLIPGGEFSIYKKEDVIQGYPITEYNGKEILEA